MDDKDIVYRRFEKEIRAMRMSFNDDCENMGAAIHGRKLTSEQRVVIAAVMRREVLKGLCWESCCHEFGVGDEEEDGVEEEEEDDEEKEVNEGEENAGEEKSDEGQEDDEADDAGATHQSGEHLAEVAGNLSLLGVAVEDLASSSSCNASSAWTTASCLPPRHI